MELHDIFESKVETISIDKYVKKKLHTIFDTSFISFTIGIQTFVIKHTFKD